MKKLIFIAIFCFLLGCSVDFSQSNDFPGEWKYSDLRMVDPPDFLEATKDIVGFYFRDLGETIEFRLDLLDLDPDNPTGLMIAFSYGYPGIRQLPFGLRSVKDWNQLLILLPNGRIIYLDEEFNQIEGPKVSVIRDTILDAVIIKIERAAISNFSQKTSVELFSISEDYSHLDALGPILLSGRPPEPKKIIIAFWNTFQSDTSAQALRAWDGAHTGPSSTRHGLKALLEAVEVSRIPVYLLDLRSYQHLSVLDYLGVLPYIESLEENGLVILPIKDNYTFPEPNFDEITIDQIDSIPENSPSIETRNAILNTFHNPNSIIFLGGDFSKSAWGNFDTAIKILNYIKNHPWLKPLNEKAILTPKPTEDPIFVDDRIKNIQEKLLFLPDNSIKQVLQMFITTFFEMEENKEKELKRQYLGQMGHLLAILEWSKNPQETTDCSKDLDWDCNSECFLATDTTAAVLETDGGYISFAFTYNSGVFHQIIGPSFQLITGLSDPIEWDISKGIGADPKVIPGAFVNSNQKWTSYSPAQIYPGSIVLKNFETGILKTFTALEDGYLFYYSGPKTDQLLLPILLDPWVMEYHDWGDMFDFTSDLGIKKWELQDKIIINLQASAPIEMHTLRTYMSLFGYLSSLVWLIPKVTFYPSPLHLLKSKLMVK